MKQTDRQERRIFFKKRGLNSFLPLLVRVISLIIISPTPDVLRQLHCLILCYFFEEWIRDYKCNTQTVGKVLINPLISFSVYWDRTKTRKQVMLNVRKFSYINDINNNPEQSHQICFFMHTGGEVFYGRVPIRETTRKNREETLNKIATRKNIQEEKTQNKRAAP